jgi:hypothetical protein
MAYRAETKISRLAGPGQGSFSSNLNHKVSMYSSFWRFYQCATLHNRCYAHSEGSLDLGKAGPFL